MQAMSELSGHNALVTGAARRLGRAIALGLARAGVNVIVHYRSSADEAADLVAEINALGPKGYALPADLAVSEKADALLPRATDLAGPIDFLINNASFFQESRLASVAPEQILNNVSVHAAAPLLLSRRLAAQNRPGAIINMLDTRVADYDKDHVAYHLSKRMLLSLTRMMAIEFAPRIRVNGIAPGLILPPEGKDEDYLKQLAPTNPLNTYGNTDDVVEAALFLLRSNFVTGQIIYVDGGRSLRGAVYG